MTTTARTGTNGLQLNIKAENTRKCGEHDGREAMADGVGLVERGRNWGEREVEKSVVAIREV
jgi:hypothetical protein